MVVIWLRVGQGPVPSGSASWMPSSAPRSGVMNGVLVTAFGTEWLKVAR